MLVESTKNQLIIFRVDASIQIGSGHVMRCLTLADALSKKNARCLFICGQHSGNMISFIEDKGYTVFPLDVPKEGYLNVAKGKVLEYARWLGATQSDDAQASMNVLQSLRQTEKMDWLIVDHYALDYHWHQQLREHTHKLMVIDDLVDRQHDCDLLLDQTFGRSKQDYKCLVPELCTVLTGSHYALLRPEFAEWREYSLNRRKKPEFKHILITLGGIDKDNVTSYILTAIIGSSFPLDCRITVVLGVNSPWIDSVKKQTESLQWKVEVKVNVENMAQLMANSDLCIGAAGSTTWERCCLGLPTVMFTLADNQKNITNILNKHKVIYLAQRNQDLVRFISVLGENNNPLSLLTQRSKSICNGLGVNAVVNSIMDKKCLVA